MKLKIIIGLFLLLNTSVFAQEPILDKIARETCEYLKSDEMKELSKDDLTIKLGVYILGLYTKYKKELNKEGIKFDLNEMSDSGRKFGEQVGMNMIKFCPDTLILLAGETLTDDDLEVEETVIEEESVFGVINSVKGDEISTVIVKDDSGKSQKFLWLSNFKGSDRLIENKKLKRQKVRVYYKNIEVYSPKLQEYIIRKQITRIDYL